MKRDLEAEAVFMVTAAMEPLDELQRIRVVDWARSRYASNDLIGVMASMAQALATARGAVKLAIENCQPCNGSGIVGDAPCSACLDLRTYAKESA